MSFEPFQEGDHPDLSYVHENPALFSLEAKENDSCLDALIANTRNAIFMSLLWWK
jgi:hypothetical protein